MTNNNGREKESKTLSTVNPYVPSAELVCFVQALLSPEVRGKVRVAEKITGVDKGKYYHALKKPEFNRWLSAQVKDFLASAWPRIAVVIVGEANKGNMSAIRTYLEIEGRINGGVNVTNINADIKQPLIIIGPGAFKQIPAPEVPAAEVIDVPEGEKKP